MSSLREERNPPPEPTPMSPEDMTKSWSTQKIINRVLITVAVIGAIATFVLALRVAQPHQTVVHHPNAVDSMRVEVAALKDTIAVLRTKIPNLASSRRPRLH